jgi:hypothetical protein
MSSEYVALFHSNKDDENPEDFLHSFFQQMGSSSDNVKKQQFPNFLQADSMADEWFKDLVANDKADWTTIEMAFRTRWLRKKAAKKTKEEYKEEISNSCLRMEDLSKKEKVSGHGIYSHITWADKMVTVIWGAKLESTTMYIGHIRKENSHHSTSETDPQVPPHLLDIQPHHQRTLSQATVNTIFPHLHKIGPQCQTTPPDHCPHRRTG